MTNKELDKKIIDAISLEELIRIAGKDLRSMSWHSDNRVIAKSGANSKQPRKLYSAFSAKEAIIKLVNDNKPPIEQKGETVKYNSIDAKLDDIFRPLQMVEGFEFPCPICGADPSSIKPTIKSLIKEVCEEVIGEDFYIDNTAKELYSNTQLDRLNTSNITKAEQRDKLNKILGE